MDFREFVDRIKGSGIMMLKHQQLKSNGDFCLLEGPFDKKQHQNQQNGLDKYVRVVNEHTGEICEKKLYENTKGLHFKHSGLPPSYLNDFTQDVMYVPFQIIPNDLMAFPDLPLPESE